jgi:integrase
LRVDGKLRRERIGRDRKTAERALRKIGVQVDEGAYRTPENVAFDVWAERWLASLKRPKDSTKDSYRSTVGYAVAAFGSKPVRRVGPADVDHFLALLAEKGLSGSTQAKHLRVLHACLSSATKRGLAARNPLDALESSQRPRARRRESAYFESDELPRLLAAIPPGVHRLLVLVAVKTGMRVGELLALTWADVDLLEAVVRVRGSYSGGRLSTPKNHERRDVDLSPDLVEALAAWWAELRRPAETTLVFPGATGHLDAANVLRSVLYPAMREAGIPRVGPTGEPRTFHSLRHTFARIALESGTELTWLSRHLGHSSTAVTDGVYGHWSRAARKAEARKLEGAFGTLTI